jgi:hypothetical protein
MLRKIMIALTVLIAVGALSNSADARPVFHGGGARWHGGHWHGGWGWGWGWPAAVGFGVGYGVGYYGYGYPYYGGCWRAVRVGTPYGWRWRRVWVCG